MKKVLIVDDSLTVRMDLAQAFDSAGFQAVTCSTAAEARRAFAAGSIPLVVLDVLLPDADGFELLEEIRAHGNDTIVLMLTSEADVAGRIRGLRRGADDYVGKPYDSSYVVARSTELLRVRSAATGPEALHVLLIDDSTTFRESLRAALVAEGYLVTTAASGEEGLLAAGRSRPNAVIVDGIMPGIDGTTVVRRIRLDPTLRRTPCVLLTGEEEVRAELRALDAGADAFVRKSEDVAVILARLRAATRAAGAAADDLAQSLRGSKRVLAVDDSPTYLHLLADALSGEGYDVVLARSGEEALELLAIQPVDCILLDLMMPGLGGNETCRRIKEAPQMRDIPLIMLTATQERDAMIEGLAAGADDYITKTAELVVLKARLRAQLRRKQFEDENRRFREELLRREIEAAEARAAQTVAETRAAAADALAAKNRELEAFSYSVSHDLRAPLRAIDGFSQALLEDHADQLDETGHDYLRRVCGATQRMGELIDDLLELSRVSRQELTRTPIDLGELAHEIVRGLRRSTPGRVAEIVIGAELVAQVDPRLMRVALENLLGNAWKFTARREAAEITFDCAVQVGERVFFVRDNGAGFDARHAHKLFAPFQRLHTQEEFGGTGIGLATVQRIVDRHGGRVWAESELGAGATFHFTLPSATFAPR